MKTTIDLREGDCREVLKAIPDNSIDSCVTDPPYALVSIVKRFGKTAQSDLTRTSARVRSGADGYARSARGFMGQQWDTGETAFAVEFWEQVYRVLKPGGHVLAFSGTRTYHRMACAIEDAGFEIRDQIGWLYGTGFPKSHDVGDGWGTAVKPAWEPICLARKPIEEKTVAANVLKWGTGAINIDGCRVGTTVETWPSSRSYAPGKKQPGGKGKTESTGSVPAGRFPANVIHDGSDEVIASFPDSKGQQGRVSGNEPSECHSGVYSGPRERIPFEPRNDSGSAARFFYSAKANKTDRAGSKHPTVKPVSLMRYLCRLVTPPGGVVLDPFAGSGTTGQAAYEEGFNSIIIERELEYIEDIKKRIEKVYAGPAQPDLLAA